jgi:hypothetical protein
MSEHQLAISGRHGRRFAYRDGGTITQMPAIMITAKMNQ